MAGTDGAGHHDGRRAAVAMALVAVALWSSNAVVARFLGDAISPWMMSWLRWLIPFIVFLPLVRKPFRSARRKLLANARLLVMLSGLGFVAHTVFFYVGLTDTTAINASALLSLTPIWIMLILLARGAPVTPVQWAGIVLSIAGRAHVGRPSDPGPWLGLGGAVLLLATLWRAVGAVHGVGWPVLAGAALLWCLAFGILAWRVAPGLWLARTDGKTGCAD